LSSNLPPPRSNFVSLGCRNDYRVVLTAPVMTKKSLRGFTLFELLVVIAMIAILSTIAYPVFIGVEFQGTANTTSQANLAASPNITVLGIGGSPPPPAPPLPAWATSNPGNYNAIGGTHSSHKQINALFADWHAENMLWTTFTNNPTSAVDPDYLRWHPYAP